MKIFNFILNKQMKVYEKSSIFIFQGFLTLDAVLNFVKRVR